MARVRSPNRDKAFEIYVKSKGKILLKDIALQLNVSDSQIRKWKNQDKWEEKLKGNITNEIKGNVTNEKRISDKSKNSKKANKCSAICEVEEVLKNDELTDKQRLFCIYYIKCFNATKAAIKAGYSKDTAGEQGYQLLQKTSIKNEIQKLKQNKLNRAMLSEDDIFQRYIDIAFADITDYITFGQEEVPVMGPFGPLEVEGEKVTKIINVVKFKESSEADGTIISKVKQGKDGASIKLQDKMKALQWLSDRMDLLPTSTRAKLENEKAKLELDKYKTLGDEDSDNNDSIQNFLKATSMSEEDIKSLFDDEGDKDGIT